MRFSVLASAVFSLLLFATNASAADYAIAPFKVNGSKSYEYLQNAIPPMLNSRLFSAGINEPVANQDSLYQGKAPTNQQNAEKIRQQYKADYLIYGTVNVIGEQASLDINVVGKNNYSWHGSDNNSVHNLLASVESIANQINQNVFKTNGTAQVARSSQNSSFINNETGAPSTSYLNPELRYQGTEENKQRSQTMPYESVGMEVADFDGNGFNEVLLADRNELIMYNYTNGQAKEIARHKLSSSLEILRFRALPYKGKNYLVVAATDTANYDAKSYIFTFNGKKFQEVLSSRYYLNVARTNAHGELELVGQNSDATRFVKGAVFRVNFDGKNISKGSSLSLLPSKADVFNFTWIPSTQDSGNVLAVLDDQDHLLIYNSKGKILTKTDEYYASGANRVRITRDIGGFVSQEGSQDAIYHYIPNTINVTDLDHDGKYEIILSKPLSVAANLLNNYRNYAQGEVHALVWDGVGANLLWKTRRIKGTICDVKIADANNDGVLDLVINVNTYPGTLGGSKIRTFITSYPVHTDNINKSAVNFAE